MFYGREEELDRLNKRYKGDNFEFIPIYGRRRVGKTALIQEFMRGKKGIYFSARAISPENNLAILGKKVFGFSDSVYIGIDNILERVFEMAEHERFILAIDEYPRLVRDGAGISDAIQEFIDRYHETSKLFLILSGSALSIMEHEVLGTKSPLYGRHTGSLKLKPFSYFESRHFLNGFEEEDRLRIYSMVGGIPLYLRQFVPGKTLNENIIDSFLTIDGFFNDEHTVMLLEEFTKPATYERVLSAIASGCTKANKIAQKAQMSSNLASKYISDLVMLDIVRRDTPVDDGNGRIVRYRIADPYLNFHYRYIAQLSDDMDEEERETASCNLAEAVQNDIGFTFETVCTQYLQRKWGGKPGKWWGSNRYTKTAEEIDIVMTKIDADFRKIGLFVECKYKNSTIGTDDLQKLIERSDLVKGYGSKQYAICSKSGFTDDLKGRDGVILLSFEDMIRGWPRDGSEQ